MKRTTKKCLFLNGETDEKFSNQQEYVLLLLAEKKIGKGNGFPSSKCHRKGDSRVWEGTDAAQKSKPL
jgi:hypothetical protein